MILAASDLSPRSAAVAGRAMLLAAALGTQVRLVHLREGALPKLGARRKPDAAALLAQQAAEAAAALSLPLPEVQVHDAAPRGGVVAGLAHLAQGARLIVLGLHRERGVLDLLRMTTLERMVLAAPAPVLVAHRLPVRPYARVLAASDFAPASVAAMTLAARIAPQAQFHAVHALRLPLGAGEKSAAHDAALTLAETLRAAFESAPGMPALHEPTLLVPGPVHEVLAYRQGELDADLICIGTHSGRLPEALGNHARDLLRWPPTDVLVAKPG